MYDVTGYVSMMTSRLSILGVSIQIEYDFSGQESFTGDVMQITRCNADSKC